MLHVLLVWHNNTTPTHTPAEMARAFVMVLLLAAAVLAGVACGVATATPEHTSVRARPSSAAWQVPPPLTSSAPDVNCSVCKEIAAFAGPILRSNTSEKIIEWVATVGCEIFKIRCSGDRQCEELCPDIVHLFADEALEVFTQPEVLCASLKLCPAPLPPPPPSPDAKVPVPANLSDTTGEKNWPSWSKSTGQGWALHLTDVHLDLAYVPGNAVQCGLPLCCRNDSGSAAGNASNAAGYWGDLRTGDGSGCDTPLHTYESALQAIAQNHNDGTRELDFVMYTGDSPAHYVWETSKDGNVYVINTIAALLNKYLPDVPVLNALGNHESSPVNQFAGPGGDDWLYNAAADAWSHNLPAQALRTLRYGGYYAARARPGLFVVSLNLNLEQDGDLFNKDKSDDLGSQLNWLEDTLRQVRELGAKAVLIGHEPSVEAPFDAYLSAIVTNFSDVIADQFRGHTHTEDVCVVHDDAASPQHTMYIAGSITTYSHQNSGYQLYSFDRALPRHNLVDDFEQYWLDIMSANTNNDTSAWVKPRMSAKQQYGMADLTPASWIDMATRMSNDTSLFHSWVANRYKGIGGSQDGLTDDVCFVKACGKAAYDKCVGKMGAAEARYSGTC